MSRPEDGDTAAECLDTIGSAQRIPIWPKVTTDWRARAGYGPRNIAVIRHTALNLLSSAKPTISLKNRSKRAGRNSAYLAGRLTRIA